MTLGQKIEASARKNLYPIVKFAGLGQIKEETLAKVFDGYIKFMKFLFKVITGLTISLTFIWFLPVYMKIPVINVILIAVVVIFLYLKFGTIRVKFDD